jgi:hypothetical protein
VVPVKVLFAEEDNTTTHMELDPYLGLESAKHGSSVPSLGDKKLLVLITTGDQSRRVGMKVNPGGESIITGTNLNVDSIPMRGHENVGHREGVHVTAAGVEFVPDSEGEDEPGRLVEREVRSELGRTVQSPSPRGGFNLTAKQREDLVESEACTKVSRAAQSPCSRGGFNLPAQQHDVLRREEKRRRSMDGCVTADGCVPPGVTVGSCSVSLGLESAAACPALEEDSLHGWKTNLSVEYFVGFAKSDVGLRQRAGSRKKVKTCYILEDPITKELHTRVADGFVNWAPVVRDKFAWLEEYIGQVECLDFDDDEGYCRCVGDRNQGCVCGPSCVLKLALAECGMGSHRGRNCGNKRIAYAVLRKSFPNCEVFDAGGVGLGLRACEFIPANMVVGIYLGRVKKGDVVTPRQSKRGHCYQVCVQESIPATSSVPAVEGYHIDASDAGNTMRYVNSSCEPNVRMEVWTVGGRRTIVYVTMRGVWDGEQLTTSYGDGTWKGTCHCRSRSCKGTLSPSTPK